MKNKKKITVLTIAILLVTILSILTYNLSLNKEVIISNHIIKSKKNNLISVLIETSYGSGEYRESTTSAWPDGYSINKDLSKCQNGSELSYDEENKKVEVAAVKSDRCYIYFDAAPEDDIHIAVSNIPTKPYEKQANLSCTGGSSTYNQKYQRIEISSLNNSVICTLNYTDRTSKTYLNDYIIGLSGTTQGTGQVVNEKGYRYEGKNPNNYIWFNNELWRIIGVFDSETHGQTGENLVKIIRNESIGDLVFDKDNVNALGTSSLYKLLNPVSGNAKSGAYYNKTSGTESGFCYGLYSTVISTNCDYRFIGISDLYRPMIKNVNWYFGGYYQASTAVNMYSYERHDDYSRPSVITGYIGLMNLSDYGYSTLSSSCSRTTSLSGYGTAGCAGESWIYDDIQEWTITRNTTGDNLYYITRYGQAGYSNAVSGFNVRPVLYLDSRVYKIDGTGTRSNPYTIGL